MLRLSIETINSHSPYNIRLSDDGSFCFTTDEALTYEIGFVEDHMIAIENAYQFFLMPKSDANVQKDERTIRTTKTRRCRMKKFSLTRVNHHQRL